MILFGASGHAKVVVELLLLNNCTIDKIVDDFPVVDQIYGIPVEQNKIVLCTDKAFISIGNNLIRKAISEKYLCDYQTIIHPTAAISRFSEIGMGTIVLAQAVVNAGAKVGKHCVINSGAIVEHDVILENFVHVCPNTSIAGNVLVGEGTQIGIGATVIQGIKIGKWCIIGAGSVIIRDVADYTVVAGNPGKIIRKNIDH